MTVLLIIAGRRFECWIEFAGYESLLVDLGHCPLFHSLFVFLTKALAQFVN